LSSRSKFTTSRREELFGYGGTVLITLEARRASGVLIELADVGSLPEEYEGQARSLGYDMARIGELLLASS
jgi:hypothetical protein